MKTNEQVKKRPLFKSVQDFKINIVFSKGAKGGNIYPQNCHHTSEIRIDYNFPNACCDEAFKDCQVAIEYIEQAVNCHDKLLSALKAVSKCERGVHLPADVVFNMMEAINEAEQ